MSSTSPSKITDLLNLRASAHGLVNNLDLECAWVVCGALARGGSLREGSDNGREGERSVCVVHFG